MGFDVIHMNLHKTFSTPHGGGGPGAGAVGVSERLLPFLPVPLVGSDGERYRWLAEKDLPQSIGRLSAFMGNAGVLLRAYIYMRMLGREGMHRVGEFATLNANYLMARLAGRRASRPPIRSGAPATSSSSPLKREARELGVTAMDFAKRLLDYGFHAPTTYFPLLVPGVPADRADRDREQGRARRLRRRAWSRSARKRRPTPEAARARRTPCRCAASTTCARRGSSTSPGPRPDA